MTELADIRAGLAANLNTALSGIQCTGYLLGSPTAPGFEIELHPNGVGFDRAMGRGLDEWFMIVRGYVASNLDLAAQKKLDLWLASSGATSVKAAIEADRTLGINDVDCVVTEATGYRQYTVASAPNVTYLGAEWTIRVLAPG